jgi:sugar phosphate isomerase/epimerase
MMHNSSRRQFLHTTGAATLAAALPSGAQALPQPAGAPLKLSVFSKHLQFLGWEAMAQTAREIGFEGVDLTLRKGGHIEPERAETDLPKAAAAIRQAGLELTMVTAGIVDATSPHVETMLRAMKVVGLKYYRWGGFKYDENRPLPPQLDELKQRAARLAELNRKYDLCAMYHTHSGAEVGAPCWDLWLILKDLDPARVSVNLDICHATIEGGLGAWVRHAQLLLPLTRGLALKDFRWERTAKGDWRPQKCPLGEGMVNFKKFFALAKAANFNGPVQVHFEYPLGGAESGATKLTLDPAQVVSAMKKDVAVLRGWLREAGLS